ncbi:MAG: AAA family ATPase [Ilumatobacteraceae bacterium]
MITLVGRATERRRLSDAFRQVSGSGEARAVELIGHPGIGKSSVLAAACDEFAKQGHRVLRGGLSEAEVDLSWAGLATLVDDLLDDRSADLPDTVLEPLRAALGRSADGSTDAGSVAFALQSALRILGERGPVVVAVDDTQWLDKPTAAALTFALRVRGPVLFLLARRRDEESQLDAPRAMGEERVDVVGLGGLSVAGVHELMEQIGGRHRGRHDLVRLHELTGGNPLFVDRLARLLRDGASLDTMDVPADLERALGAQLRGLPTATLQLAGFVALAGRVAEPVLRALCGEGYATAFSDAHARHLVDESGGVVEASHPLVRQVIAEQLPAPERRRMHRALAECVADSEARAWHMAEGADGPDAAVADALEAAADLATARGAPEAAVKLLLRAADATPLDQGAQAWERRSAAGMAAVGAGSWPRAKELIDAAFDSAPTVEDRCSMAWIRMVVWHRVSPVPVTRALAMSMIEEFGDVDPIVRCRLLRGVSQISIFDDVPQCVEYGRKAVAAAVATGDQVQRLLSETALLQGMTFAGELIDISSLEREVADVEDDDDRAYLEEKLIDLLRYVGRSAEALRSNEVILAQARRTGDVTLLINALSGASSVSETLGDLRGALAYNEEQLTLPAQYDSAIDMASARAANCRLTMLLGGDPGDQPAALEAMLPEVPIGVRYEVLAEIGGAMVVCGDYVRGEQWLDRAADEARAWGYGDVRILPIAHVLVEARVRLGQIERAARVADWVTGATVGMNARALALAAKCRGMVSAARGDRDEAIVHFEEALRQHELAADTFENALTQIEYGVALRGARRRKDARVVLEEAATLLGEIGLVHGERRAREELARLGDTPTAAANALTPTEQRIAEMAAAGATNSEIGAVLYVNARTVESNLTRIYRKLGVRSRTELAAHAKVHGL